jgi:hypothetical protein
MWRGRSEFPLWLGETQYLEEMGSTSLHRTEPPTRVQATHPKRRLEWQGMQVLLEKTSEQPVTTSSLESKDMDLRPSLVTYWLRDLRHRI